MWKGAGGATLGRWPGQGIPGTGTQTGGPGSGCALERLEDVTAATRKHATRQREIRGTQLLAGGRTIYDRRTVPEAGVSYRSFAIRPVIRVSLANVSRTATRRSAVQTEAYYW
jgi:hypothetical protein